MGVSVDPGDTAAAVTPVPTRSAARPRTIPITACLAAVYADSQYRPWLPAADATATNRHPDGSGPRSIAGTVTAAVFHTPLTSTSQRRSNSASFVSQSGRPPAMTAAAATATSSRPHRSTALATAECESVAVADVGYHRQHPVTELGGERAQVGPASERITGPTPLVVTLA